MSVQAVDIGVQIVTHLSSDLICITFNKIRILYDKLSWDWRRWSTSITQCTVWSHFMPILYSEIWKILIKSHFM